MDRYTAAARSVLYGFVALFALLVIVSYVEPNDEAGNFMLFEGGVFVAAFLVVIPGLYLWVTGFARYKAYLGGYGVRWVIYAAVLPVVYAVYIQLRCRHEAVCS